MTVVLFIVILAVLVFVHELGHFSLAKLFGIRVDEFALGFPPRIISKKIGETLYALNIVPFGGYVKIFGEEAIDVLPDSPDRARSFIAKNRAVQALVLLGGILMNIIFAWVLLSLVFMTGAPVSTEQYVGAHLENERLLIVDVLPLSPADVAGIKAGDAILNMSASSDDRLSSVSIKNVQEFIAAHESKTLTINLKRSGQDLSLEVTPKKGVVSAVAGIGISMDQVGTLKLPFFSALWEGGKRTIDLFLVIAQAIGVFLYQVVTGHADFSQVSGPVGIAVMVGSATSLGFFYLISFTAIISLNLAVINVIPFPALDGGRLFFVLIEALIRRPLPPKVTRTLNAVGFGLLLLLLVLITYKDIVHLL